MKFWNYLIIAIILLAIILITKLAPVSAGVVQTQIFSDSFENGEWNSLWTETGEGDWAIESAGSGITQDGSNVAHFDNCDSECNLTSANINCAGYANCILTYNYGTTGLDAGETLSIDIYNTTSNSWKKAVVRYTGGVEGSATINLTGFGLDTDNAIRLRGNSSGGMGTNEFGEADLVVVTGISWAEDTCTAPASGDWALNCADNCTWNSNQVIPANITITGNGILTLNKNFTFSGTSQYVFMNSGCQFNINRGGGFA